MITIEETLNGADINEFLLKCSLDIKTGFNFFCKKLLNLELTPFHIEWAEAFERFPRSVIEAPRQHGKTTVLAKAYPLWKIFFNDNLDFLIISHRMEHSTEILNDIKQYIYNSELLSKRLIPEDKRKFIWRKTIMQSKTNCTVSCKPNTHAICGGVYDYVLCDELSLYQDHDVYFKDIVPTVGTRQGHIMCIATPKTGVDLLARIKEIAEQKGGYFYKKYRAFTDEGFPLWPKMYPPESWKQIKSSITSLDFQREYMCELVDEKTQVFPLSLIIKAYDPENFFDKTNNGMRYFAGSDLARSPEGDYNVHTIVRLDSQNFITIAYIHRTKGMDVSSRAHQMAELYALYKPERYLIDESYDGKAVIDELMNTYHIFANGFVFRPDERYRILTNLVNLFEKNRIKIPSQEGDYITATMAHQLTKELCDIIRDITPTGQPTYKTLGKHEDMVISLAMAIEAIGASSEIGNISDYFIITPIQKKKLQLKERSDSFFI